MDSCVEEGVLVMERRRGTDETTLIHPATPKQTRWHDRNELGPPLKRQHNLTEAHIKIRRITNSPFSKHAYGNSPKRRQGGQLG